MEPDWEAVAPSPPADVALIGDPESASRAVTRPVPEVPWYWRAVTSVGACQPVVADDLFDHRDTIQEVRSVAAVGVV